MDGQLVDVLESMDCPSETCEPRPAAVETPSPDEKWELDEATTVLGVDHLLERMRAPERLASAAPTNVSWEAGG